MAVAASIAGGVIVPNALAQQCSNVAATTKARYLPEYTASGDLRLPKTFRDWVYVGSPLTPKASMTATPTFMTDTSSQARMRYTYKHGHKTHTAVTASRFLDVAFGFQDHPSRAENP
jgi:hypothetical protein